MTDKIEVLDKGYVRYVKHMGDDLDPVNSAKVSFAKESAEFGDREARLLAFLQREEHSSVFRHSAITFEVYAPLFVARQWWKYAVASTHLEDQNGWNESSRRYVTETPEFYIPDFNEWRSAPDNRKQGSGEPIEGAKGMAFTKAIEQYAQEGVNLYDLAMENGVCAEQARLFLPAYGLYVRWRWTASLGAITHFLHQRLEHDAQKEIQLFAEAVWELTHEKFPVCMETIRKS
ncbi:ThyX-like thymidylate synthase [Streptomyces phage Faust]|uniref:ThyX-like thymidylate synthase n=1 Tax=Streptomyces phage Faust TaxID=2767565 RepID=A0A7G9UYL0_9CAUD|nr:thymidylate synthase [Streptomyces phage Faust]QNN99115.1 ThyX-like thymidylate synthase [Streptomyces phage Faust]